MPKHYHHLTYEQRCQIYALKKRGLSQSTIAQQLHVHKSTISREIRRNQGQRGYRYKQAQEQAVSRRQQASAAPKKMTPELVKQLEEKLINYQWSPEQISGWLKRHKKISISPERIYQHVWKDKRHNGTLYCYLRHQGKKYTRRGQKQAGRGVIPGRVDIDERPAIVDEKSRLGDWELDTIIGTRNSGVIVSMVERKSKLTKLVLVPNKTAEIVTQAIQMALAPLKAWVITLTADNGKEFAKHTDIAKALDASVYFAKPYQSWQRGLNEHTNGLVRQYFPKSKRFDTITQDDVRRVEHLLNNRPRKVLNFKTPQEIFDLERTA